jgi:hypothetical protein
MQSPDCRCEIIRLQNQVAHTITYDWQEAQVQNSFGATLAQIMKVASNTQVWTQVTYDLTTYKGQTIRV